MDFIQKQYVTFILEPITRLHFRYQIRMTENASNELMEKVIFH